MDMGERRMNQVNGISIYIEDHGSGVPILLFLHGSPDSAALWRSQIPVLVAHGFRVIGTPSGAWSAAGY